VDFTSAAMTEPLACVTHAIYDLTRIVPGNVVLVSGPGSVGLMAAQIAKVHGATVVVSGTNVDEPRLEMAKKLGADHTFNVEKGDLIEFLKPLTRGYGSDVVLECSGSQRGTDAGLNAIKKRGWFTQIGLPGKKIEFDIEKVCYKELRFSGSLGSRNASWRKALQLLSEGKVNVKPLVSDKLSILEWERAFEMFEKKKGGKIYLLPVGD